MKSNMAVKINKSLHPFLLLIFLTSFVDIGHKVLLQNALYHTTAAAHYYVFTATINALMFLPFLLMFTPSGFLADKFPKANVLRYTALSTIPITLLITLCYKLGFFWGAFSLTLILAMQSALSTPARFGYIKETFGKESIAPINGYLQAFAALGILVSIVSFTIFFKYLININSLTSTINTNSALKAMAPSGFLLIFAAIVETLTTYYLIVTDGANRTSHYDQKSYFKGKYSIKYLRSLAANKTILVSTLGLGLFWGVTAVLLTNVNNILPSSLHVGGNIFTQIALASSAFGYILGSLYTGKISKGFVEIGIVPASALGIAITLLFLPIVSNKFSYLLVFYGFGFFGGMLSVALNSLIQFNAPNKDLGKILAGSHFIKNLFMLSFLCLTVVLSIYEIKSSYLIQASSVIAFSASLITLIALPQSLIRYLLYFVVSKFYSLSVYQLNNLPSTGGVLLLGNHISFIDWAILQLASPRPIRFVMERSIYEKWYLKWLLKQFKIIPIAKNASKEALEQINIALKSGEVVALFPEGRLSCNGQMGTFHSGFERAALNTGAVIIPFYLHGLWGAKTSYATEHYKDLAKMNNRGVSVIYGEPMPISATADEVRKAVRTLSIKSWEYFTNEMQSIQYEWLKVAKKQGNKTSVIDSSGSRFQAHKLIATVIYFAKRLNPIFKNDDNVGVILPASVAGVIANLSVLSRGKTVVNLNYTAPLKSLEAAIEEAHIKTIITSVAFLDKLKDKGFDLTTLQQKANLVYLENFKVKTTKVSIARNLILVKLLPFSLLKAYFVKAKDVNSVAAILFSSGSEGKPKGVMLTHRNILSNIKQVTSVFAIRKDDVMLNSLPLFHAFGLTMTSFVPLVQGLTMVCYPDPTNALQIARLIYNHNVTMFCATSTFLSMYNRNHKIHPLLLSPLRLVISGAEKLKDTVRDEFKHKFGHVVYEGYGATELSPVASCNLPDVISPADWYIQIGNKPGTVGLALPGSAFRVVDPNTLEDLPANTDGLILLAGPQVMPGYLHNPEKSGEVLHLENDITWYKTGDKGRLDEDGYLTIVDRYSRFAKVGGEMVSLGAVEENFLNTINTESTEVIAIAVSHHKKGEAIAILYNSDLAEDEALQKLKSSEFPRIMLPTYIYKIGEVPKLASGKKDYATAKKIIKNYQETEHSHDKAEIEVA